MLVSQFLTNLKRRGQIQAAQTVLSDSDFLGFANDQMRTVICPKILSLRDNFFVGQKNYSLSGKRRYRLPPRVLGGRISAVTIVPGDGTFYDLQQTNNTDKSTANRRGFYVTEGDIVLTGDLPSGTMTVKYPVRPPKMSSSAVALGALSAVGASSVVSGSLTGTSQVIRSSSPFRTISPSVTFSLGTGVDNDSSDYQRYQVSDIVIAVDSTHIVPLQEQLCDWLLQRTYMRVLQALGQSQQLGAAGSKLADIQKDVMALMSPRVENSPKVIYGMQAAGWRD